MITVSDENSILQLPSYNSEDLRNVSLKSRQTQNNIAKDLHEIPLCESEPVIS